MEFHALSHLIELSNPVVNHPDVALFLFLGVVYLGIIWLDQDVFLLLALTSKRYGGLSRLSNVGTWTNQNGSLEVLLVRTSVILELAVVVQLEKSNLLISIPVLLNQSALAEYFVSELVEASAGLGHHALALVRHVVAQKGVLLLGQVQESGHLLVLLGADLGEVDSLEEGVLFEDLHRLQSGSQAVFWLDLDHSVDEVVGLLAHYLLEDLLLWPPDLSVLDVPVNRVLIGPLERHVAGKHLEEDVAKGPDVHSESLGLPIDHLWRLIIHCADKGVSSLEAWTAVGQVLTILRRLFLLGLLGFLVDLSCVSEIDDLDIKVLVKHDVLRL